MDPRLWVDRLVLERVGLYVSLLGLDEATLVGRPLCGVWTARDVLAHILAWESRLARHLPDLLADRGMQMADVCHDAFNAEQVALRQAVALVDVAGQLEQALETIVHTLDRVDAAELSRLRRVPWAETSIADWVRMEAEHNAAHAASILAWRKETKAPNVAGPGCLAAAATRNACWTVGRLVGRMVPEARDGSALCGGWTAKDVVGHLADWTGTMAEAATRAGEGGALPHLPLTDEALEAWNAEHAARRRNQSWAEVWADYDAACNCAMAALEALGEEGLGRQFPDAVPPTLYHWLDLAGHDVEHAREIVTWLGQA